MTDYVRDTMTDTNWKDLHLHSGELGMPWVRHPATNPGNCRWYIFGNRVHCGVWGNLYASGEPASADYTVECDYTIYTTVSGLNLGIAGRMDPTQDTYYAVYYQAGELVLMKRVAGVTTSLGTWISTLTGGGTTYQLTLEMIGSAIKAYVNGVQRISVTDSSITAAGRGGVRSVGVNDASTGNHIDNFRVFDATSPVAAGRSFAQIVGL